MGCTPQQQKVPLRTVRVDPSLVDFLRDTQREREKSDFFFFFFFSGPDPNFQRRIKKRKSGAVKLQSSHRRSTYPPPMSRSSPSPLPLFERLGPARWEKAIFFVPLPFLSSRFYLLLGDFLGVGTVTLRDE